MEEPKVEPTTQQPTQPTTQETTNVASVTSTGKKLPDTATPIYNYLAFGLILVLAGLIAFMSQHCRQKRNQSI